MSAVRTPAEIDELLTRIVALAEEIVRRLDASDHQRRPSLTVVSTDDSDA